MEKAKIILKMWDYYMVQEQPTGVIDFINVPNYDVCQNHEQSISIFMMLLYSGKLSDNLTGKEIIDYGDIYEYGEYYNPDFLVEITNGIYYYDIFGDNSPYDKEIEIVSENIFNNTPASLVCYRYNELKKVVSNQNHQITDEELSDDKLLYMDTHSFLTLDILEKIKPTAEVDRSDIPNKKVLLLYSGGKDSMLSALRLHNDGYNVFFIHFDNGYMRDTDFPFIRGVTTFNNQYISVSSFLQCQNTYDISIQVKMPNYEKTAEYCFSEMFKNVNISKHFTTLCNRIGLKLDGNLEGGSIFSELRCLCCRTAMYIEIIKIAKKLGFEYIGDGARESQDFFIEQEEMLNRYRKIANIHGIELLLPVWKVTDDKAVIQELVDGGLPAKAAEAKCLIGRPAMKKSEEDKKKILNIFDKKILPYVFQQLPISYYKSNQLIKK